MCQVKNEPMESQLWSGRTDVEHHQPRFVLVGLKQNHYIMELRPARTSQSCRPKARMNRPPYTGKLQRWCLATFCQPETRDSRHSIQLLSFEVQWEVDPKKFVCWTGLSARAPEMLSFGYFAFSLGPQREQAPSSVPKGNPTFD